MNPRPPARLLTCIAAGCAWLAAASAGATTYVRMADEDLADQAPIVAIVRVAAVEPSSEAGLPTTDYVAAVERVLKGKAAGTIRVRVPGGEGPNGTRLRVFGAPQFRVGERALLFLEPRKD